MDRTLAVLQIGCATSVASLKFAKQTVDDDSTSFTEEQLFHLFAGRNTRAGRSRVFCEWRRRAAGNRGDVEMPMNLIKRIKPWLPIRLKAETKIALHHGRLVWREAHAAATWMGQKPRVALHHEWAHGVWETYNTHPPLRYTPFALAELVHWVNPHSVAHWMQRRQRVSPRLAKPHIFEIEHAFVLQGGNVEDWENVRNSRELISSRIAPEGCRKVFTFSAGLVEHCKLFVREEFWPKLDYAYPAYPQQEWQEKGSDTPFTVLVIASRFSDKGVPEVMRAHEILRERHGTDFRTILVCQKVPADYRLPPGVTLYDIPRLNERLKAQLYRAADVFLLPCYSESAACFTEAYAFGVPVITTRIHHGEEFVREGATGHLLEVPDYCYSPEFGRRWKSWPKFLEGIELMRRQGALEKVLEQTVARLTEMISQRQNLTAMRRQAFDFHAENFSPEARNRKLLGFYRAAL